MHELADLADSLILKSKSKRFKLSLAAFLGEAYGLGWSRLEPDLECFVNAQSNTYQKERNNIGGSIQLSPVRSAIRKGKRVSIAIAPDCGDIDPSQCDLLMDSGAFTDVISGDRVTPEQALDRQIAAVAFLEEREDICFRHVYYVSYDLLIDEKHVNGGRKKIRWSVKEGEKAVEETVAAAKYLDSRRDLFTDPEYPRETIVQSCQGVDANQYYRCVEKVLEYCQPNDVIGLGGWCILGKEKRWLPTFWETINKIIPLIAEAKIKRVHIFGVTWYKPIQSHIPPLPPLLYLCDRHGIKLSTDGRSPIGNALWTDYKSAGATFPYWRHNLAWVKAELATLRESEFYMAPPNWHWSEEPLLKLL